MCGITGFLSEGEYEKKESTLKKMNSRIMSRGPDDEGYYVDEHIALAMRRLSIIGLENGKQPVWNEDKTLVLVYNGEIYNYLQLKEELQGMGHVFTTDADTEVILHGYEEYGTDVLGKLRGMFAFALWNTVSETLLIARDPFGIKPLFYCTQNNGFCFGSEIKALLANPDVRKELNEDALPGYLAFQYNPLEETFYKGIYQLLPGHFMILENGRMQIHRYWRARFHTEETMRREEAEERLKEALLNSVEAHKLSDVEVGSFLSGGIDSSFLAVAGEMEKTYSVGFEEAEYDETKKAAQLSRINGMTNHSRLITREEYWDAVPRILEALDEPVADPSVIPLYYLCELAARDVKVVYSGEGADELFGGYNVYQSALALEPFVHIMPGKIRRGLRRIMERLPFSFKGKEYLIRAGQSVEERFIGNAYIFKSQEVKELLKKKELAAYTEQDVVAAYYAETEGLDDITRMQYIDINFWMRGDILRKSDHISMAHGLEVRVPYLDAEVAGAAFSVPVRYRVTRRQTKSVFRSVSDGYLPQETAKRRKLGFPVPLRKWLNQEPYAGIVRAEFESETAERFFEKDSLIELLEQHKNGKRDNSRKIWTVYLFLLWYRENF
ncbi:asparagine synthase (glutamine-hydrolyzing) [Ruminococcus gauvreauii]|uniref:asparagine synthase (glutamine-hydrolyzing) n=1 Tax=Ruminococcus gauvreauii TaxID=438033 RepID=A0ABY5VDS9_9FIRM|nr:asparagine synthase (glutamine-hydrolyzing) [Ruminococcus gauvreauii]UWP58519.1 asparagine synthase (glutamine-hydrolyzing) [Ruminococcus gauvreauii]